ncbi:MAG TPA: acyltransferase [Rubrobacter sp.]|nr:acyltransferase [Rubrobacter sp.]
MSIISGAASYLRVVRNAIERLVTSDRPADDPDGSPAEANLKPPKEGFRPDVEGLRAVAVAAVLLYHAGVPWAPGGYVGVDVFFVISGFLITGLLLRELEKSGTLSITRFYSRRAKRLLPMTVVVLAVVVAVSWPLFDPVRMEEVSLGVVASGLYVMNWLLAFRATDYFAAGMQASPIQHFWTLGVEEQFYLIWPTLLLGVAWWSRRKGRNLRVTLAVVLGVVVISSLAYSIYSTEHEAGAAYFSTLTRGWELALGGVLALVPASALERLPRWVAGALA